MMRVTNNTPAFNKFLQEAAASAARTTALRMAENLRRTGRNVEVITEGMTSTLMSDEASRDIELGTHEKDADPAFQTELMSSGGIVRDSLKEAFKR